MNAVDAGMTLEVAQGMDVQRAEPAADILELLDIQRLIAEEQNLVAHPAVMEGIERGVSHRLAEIDAVNFGADARRQRIESKTVG